MKKYIQIGFIVVITVIQLACSKATSSNETTTPPIQIENGIDVPSGANDGVTFLNAGKSVIFNLYAPKKKSVSIIGDFNNWKTSTTYNLKNSKDGSRWWIQIDNLDPTVEYAYQYLIDGNIKVADPYTEKVLDPNNDNNIQTATYQNLKSYPSLATGIVSTFYYNQPAYNWQVTNFKRPEPKNLVIYELLVRDFVAAHDYKTIKDTLNYFVRLGINAIELMPLNEFEGNESWGYNPNFYFAPDKYYGTKNDLKALIDACHQKGIAVIQDIVLNHSFGSSPMVQMYWTGQVPSSDNPWFNAAPTHPYNVGFQFNHESSATKYFTKNVLKWWMTEYHMDGFRFDLAKGFTQTYTGNDVNAWGNYDASRVAIWKEYNTYIKSIDPNFYVILENFASNKEEEELTSTGMMTWGNMSFNGEQATMGYNDSGGSWDLSGLFYNNRSLTNPYALVAYFESHDEERLQFKNAAYGNSNGNYSIKNLATGLKRNELGAVFMLAVPGPKMIWQFGERGYDVSINDAGTGGRLGNKPPRWEYMSDINRLTLYNLYSKMIKLKINNPVFTTTSFTYNLANAFKSILLDGKEGTYLLVLGNFGVVTNTSVVAFPATGTWTDQLDNSTININQLNYTITLAPGEYHVFSNRSLIK